MAAVLAFSGPDPGGKDGAMAAFAWEGGRGTGAELLKGVLLASCGCACTFRAESAVAENSVTVRKEKLTAR
jgi:hypothetical protein